MTSTLLLFRGRGVLGDSLGALRHGVLGQLTRKDQANRRLDFPRRDGGLLVVGSELRGLGGNTLEDVCAIGQRCAKCDVLRQPTVDKRVQDGHGTVGDTSVGVDLLED
jgi:hypothetical protein